MRLRDNILWMLAGNALYMGCQWGVLVATVKLGAPAMVGDFSYAFAVCAPVFLFAQLRLRSTSATDARLDFTPADYIWLRVLGTAAALIFVPALCLLGHFSAVTGKVLMAVAAAKAIESGSDVLYGLSQQAEHMRSIAVSMMARGLLSLTFFAVLLLKTHQLLPALLGFCAGWAIVFLVYDLPLASRVMAKSGVEKGIRLNLQRVGRLFRITFPLGLTAMMMSIAANMPRYFVEHFRGASELGIFSALSYLTLCGSVVVNSMTEAAVPRFSRYMAERNHAGARHLFSHLMLVTAVFSVGGVLLAALFARPLLTHVYKAEYAGSTFLLLLLMAGAGVANLAAVCNYLLLAGRSMASHLVSLCSLTVLMMLGCFYSVPRWGAKGAAIASLIAFAIQLAWSCWSVSSSISDCVPVAKDSLPLVPGLVTDL